MDTSTETEARYGSIVWRNDALVLFDKKPCVLTVPGRQGDADPRPCLGKWLQEQLKTRLFPVHRLDFEVSGAVVFALSSQAHRTASMAFEGRAVRKRYQAITSLPGVVPADGAVFVWESRLVRGKRRSFEAPHGQLARTHARFVGRVPAGKAGPFESDGPMGLWELTPETGKPHQLRVHLTNAGFPIAGDTLYGGTTVAAELQGIALRAVSLMFQDEATRKALDVPLTFDLPLLVERF
jgi:tRNA pseudouridine32 synthase / 23S rRNA pseudouridine746 synthase